MATCKTISSAMNRNEEKLKVRKINSKDKENNEND